MGKLLRGAEGKAGQGRSKEIFLPSHTSTTCMFVQKLTGFLPFIWYIHTVHTHSMRWVSQKLLRKV